jgi:hypothetical protein
VYSKNRDRLLEGEIAAKFMAAVLTQPNVRQLLSTDHFSVDGTLVEAWASMKSLKPKGEDHERKIGVRVGSVAARGFGGCRARRPAWVRAEVAPERRDMNSRPGNSAWQSSAMRAAILACVMLLGAGLPAIAGPPYITDDPEPTDNGHYEIYLSTQGTDTRDDVSGESGIDFNDGAPPDLQLTAVLPLDYDVPIAGPSATGPGSVELAAEYRFLHQDGSGPLARVAPFHVLSPEQLRAAAMEPGAQSL